MTTIEALISYASEHRERQLEELKEWLRIPSVSALSAHKPDIIRAAEWAADKLRSAGMENVEVMATGGHPIVYGDWMHAEGKPTVLVYGHYDVQPPDPIDLWHSPPFEPVVRDGKLYARGATDDKAQLFLHVKVVEAFLQTNGELPVNLKFCMEGEEEIASPNMGAFVESNKEKLKADVILISDNPMLGKDQPVLEYGLRGLAALEIKVRGANSDLHSGLYGGGVQNPIHALTRILSSFHDENGHISVEGFYDSVIPLSLEERKALSLVSKDGEEIKKKLNVSELYGEAGYTFLERTAARPTIEITSVSGGFQGEGVKPIIPAEASAKLACRLVSAQQPDEVMARIEAHVQKVAPTGVKVTVQRLLRGNPFVTPLDHPLILEAAQAYAETYGTPSKFTRSGGSIPIIEVMNRLLGAPIVLMGFGLPDENMHAPNENFDLYNWDKGLETLFRYLEKLKTWVPESIQ
jgi:acetylornithine deacetylase/succinyl-diaminopimelate desuccinylase-like protein